MAGYLGQKPAVKGLYTVDEFTSSGGTTYTLSRTPGDKNNIQVSAGGLVQYPSAYSVSGTTLTLSGVPSGQKVIVRHFGDTTLYPYLDDDSVTLAKMASGTDGNIITYDASGNPVAVATGTVGQVLTSAGAGAPPTFAAAAAGGKVLQVVHTESGAVATTTTVMPFDDTINTSSEGGEFFTLAITPANVSNKLIIQSVVHYSHSASNTFCTANLYQDSTAASISTIGTTMERVATDQTSMAGLHYMTAGTTSATTFKIRAGGNGGGTFTLNGMSGNRKGGGQQYSGMTIWEIAV